MDPLFLKHQQAAKEYALEYHHRFGQYARFCQSLAAEVRKELNAIPCAETGQILVLRRLALEGARRQKRIRLLKLFLKCFGAGVALAAFYDLMAWLMP